MKKKVLTLFFLWMSCISYATVSSPIENRLHYLYSVSSYGSLVAEDSIIHLCNILEPLLRANKDYDNLFKVNQISIDAYCTKGEIGLAISKVQAMYTEAKELNHFVGSALAVHSLGTTYFFSNQHRQAVETFDTAEKQLNECADDDLKIRTILQQIRAYLYLKEYGKMDTHLSKAAKLLKSEKIENRRDYLLYVRFYRTLYYLGIDNQQQAKQELNQIQSMYPVNNYFHRLCYLLLSRYYASTKEYDKALLYNDSTIQAIQHLGNKSYYRKAQTNKVALLEKMGLCQLACEEYGTAKNIADSLNEERYTSQLNALRILYWVDQLKLDNASERNHFVYWAILGSIPVLLLLTGVILLIIKKNKQLVASKIKLEAVRKKSAESIHSKSLFLSNMSHELRTPLTAVVGFSGILAQEEEIDTESKMQFSECIRQNAELLLKLIHDVTDFSTLKEKEIQFTYANCDVISLCRSVVDSVEKIKQTHAALLFESEVGALELYTDSARLQQVLINLLINATKFTQEGSITLRITINPSANEVLFAVEDTGCGVPPDKQPYIFERFEKLHEGIQGAGLGLSICQLIITRIGGRIWIDPDYTSGARFVFTHPITHKPNNRKP